MELLYWLINTQTLGGLVVLAAFGGAFTTYVFMLRWIMGDAEEEEE